MTVDNSLEFMLDEEYQRCRRAGKRFVPAKVIRRWERRRSAKVVGFWLLMSLLSFAAIGVLVFLSAYGTEVSGWL